jgi:aspartate/methionine/tyrosine aminotransferase
MVVRLPITQGTQLRFFFRYLSTFSTQPPANQHFTKQGKSLLTSAEGSFTVGEVISKSKAHHPGRPFIDGHIGTFARNPHPSVIEAAQKALGDMAVYKYSSPTAPIEARAAVAVMMERFFPGSDISADHVSLITGGAKMALNQFALFKVAPGSAILTFSPFYGPYNVVAKLAHSTLFPVSLLTNTADQLLEKTIEFTKLPGKKAAIVNLSPNNPTGLGVSVANQLFIYRLLAEAGVTILSDTAYLGSDSSQYSAVSPFQLFKDSRYPIYQTASFSKGYFGLAGLRIGPLISHPNEAIPHGGDQVNILTSCPPLLMMKMIEAACSEKALDDAKPYMQAVAKRTFEFHKGLQLIPDLVTLPLTSDSPFCFINVARISEEYGISTQGISNYLMFGNMSQAGIGNLPFNDGNVSGYLRISTGALATDDLVRTALKALSDLLGDGQAIQRYLSSHPEYQLDPAQSRIDLAALDKMIATHFG